MLYIMIDERRRVIAKSFPSLVLLLVRFPSPYISRTMTTCPSISKGSIVIPVVPGLIPSKTGKY